MSKLKSYFCIGNYLKLMFINLSPNEIHYLILVNPFIENEQIYKGSPYQVMIKHYSSQLLILPIKYVQIKN